MTEALLDHLWKSTVFALKVPDVHFVNDHRIKPPV